MGSEMDLLERECRKGIGADSRGKIWQDEGRSLLILRTEGDTRYRKGTDEDCKEGYCRERGGGVDHRRTWVILYQLGVL